MIGGEGSTRLNPVQIYPGPTELSPMMLVHKADDCVWSAVMMPLRESFTIPAMVNVSESDDEDLEVGAA